MAHCVRGLLTILRSVGQMPFVKRWWIRLGQNMVYASSSYYVAVTFVQTLDLQTWVLCSSLLLGSLNVQLSLRLLLRIPAGSLLSCGFWGWLGVRLGHLAPFTWFGIFLPRVSCVCLFAPFGLEVIGEFCDARPSTAAAVPGRGTSCGVI